MVFQPTTSLVNRQEHTSSCSAKKLFYSGYFPEKIDPVLCLPGKMKYICRETLLKNFLLNGHYPCEAAEFFLKTCIIFENLLKLWMFVMKRT